MGFEIATIRLRSVLKGIKRRAAWRDKMTRILLSRCKCLIKIRMDFNWKFDSKPKLRRAEKLKCYPIR